MQLLDSQDALLPEPQSPTIILENFQDENLCAVLNSMKQLDLRVGRDLGQRAAVLFRLGGVHRPLSQRSSFFLLPVVFC